MRRIRPFWGVTAAALVLMLAVSALAWPYLPERMAVHWSGGETDGWSGRLFGVLAMPVTLLGLALVMTVLARLRTASGQLREVGWLLIVGVCTVTHLGLIGVNL